MCLPAKKLRSRIGEWGLPVFMGAANKTSGLLNELLLAFCQALRPPFFGSVGRNLMAR